MKTFSFGFNSVNSGQRNVSVEPQLIAVSTEGSFRVTPLVTKTLGIAAGDNIMFLSNIDAIDAAIRDNSDVYVDFCNEREFEVGSPESVIAIHKEFDQWAIAKGIKEFDTKGNMKTTVERLTKNDKVKFASQHFDEMLASALVEADDETKEALSRDGVSKEEQLDILSSFVKARELPKVRGAKTANPAGLTGVGVSLNFTDSNVWKQLKADLGEDASKKNRVFSVNLDNIQEQTINNGYEDVVVKVAILGEFVDKDPSRVGKVEE